MTDFQIKVFRRFYDDRPRCLPLGLYGDARTDDSGIASIPSRLPVSGTTTSRGHVASSATGVHLAAEPLHNNSAGDTRSGSSTSDDRTDSGAADTDPELLWQQYGFGGVVLRALLALAPFFVICFIFLFR